MFFIESVATTTELSATVYDFAISLRSFKFEHARLRMENADFSYPSRSTFTLYSTMLWCSPSRTTRNTRTFSFPYLLKEICSVFFFGYIRQTKKRYSITHFAFARATPVMVSERRRWWYDGKCGVLSLSQIRNSASF
jgi:hypothetical protein